MNNSSKALTEEYVLDLFEYCENLKPDFKYGGNTYDKVSVQLFDDNELWFVGHVIQTYEPDVEEFLFPLFSPPAYIKEV